jgi:Arm DNA-binding domain
VYRYQIANTPRWAGLGSAGPDGIRLAEARAKRDEMRAKILAGVDPVAVRRQQRESNRPAAVSCGRE